MGDASLLIAVQCGFVSNTDNASEPTFHFEAADNSRPGTDVLKWVVFKHDNTSSAAAFQVEYYIEQPSTAFGSIIEFKDGVPISSADPHLGATRPPLVRLKRRSDVGRKQELFDTYTDSGQRGRENRLTLSSVRRVLFFNRKFQRFPVLAIDAISGNPGDRQWTGVQLLNGSKDPFIRFRLPLRCAISSHDQPGLPHVPERITITGALSLSGQSQDDETPRVKWGLFEVSERQGLVGILKSFRATNDQTTFAEADTKLRHGSMLKDVADASDSWREGNWQERVYPRGVDLRYHALPPPLHAVLPRLDPERLLATDKDWPSQWSSQARLSIVKGPIFSERVDLAGDEWAKVQSYEIQFAVRAHRELPTERTPEESADAKAQTQRGKQPNFPLVVDFRAEPTSTAESRSNYFVIQRQPPFWCCTPLKDRTAAGDLAIPWLVAVEDVDATLVADIWNTVADRYLEAVREIRNDRKVSLFPRLTVKGDTKDADNKTVKGDEDKRKFTLIFRLLDAPDPNPETDAKHYPGEGSALQPTLWRLEPGRLQGMWAADNTLDTSAEPLFSGRAELPLFKSADGRPFAFPFVLKARRKDAFARDKAKDNWRVDVPRQIAGLDPYRKADQPEPAKLVEFLDVELHQAPDAALGGDSAADFALGAYSLTLRPGSDAALGANETKPIFQVWFDTDWKASKSSQLRGDRSDLAQRHATYAHAYYRLSLADFYPSGQDKLPDEPENSVRPVMVRLPMEAAPAQAAGQATSVEPGTPGLSLTVQESSAADARFGGVDQRQKVTLTVSSQARSTPPTDVLVIDTEPFFVAKVEVPALTPSNEDTAIATWDSEGPEGPYWRVVADRTGYSLSLPPQAIGESAVKTVKYALPPLPGRKDPQANDPNTALADFRFSPNARLKVYTSWREGKSGIVEPPFNTRRIFGFASQRAPGASLVDSAFELLYGLSATMSGAAVEGQSTRLVTELAAQEGLLPRPVSTDTPDWGADFHFDGRDKEKWPSGAKDYLGAVKALYDTQLGAVYQRFRQDWDDARTAFQRRLAVLMVQDKARGNVDALTDGVGFQLREQAQIRRPVLPVAPDSKSPYRPGGPRDELKRPPDTMLDGGADWGFESSNVYEEIWKKPSDGGELAQIYFSALGAWGRQKALFASRKSAIISQAGQGRTHFYSLERIGRIGVFWNRAKHVIVYRRSVLPSSQFKDKQAHFEGRPFLRKVLEYVELLQPERKFPEDGAAPIRRGFVQSIVFRSKIILVDSDWGQDVPEGWKVALWNPLADANLYQKPQIELRIAQDANLEAEAGPAFVAIAEPQNLVFFTSTQDGTTDDTDAWPLAHNIDYVDLPPPKQVKDGVQTHVGGQADTVLSPDRAVPGGFEPVTFVLERTSGRAANLVADRGAAVGSPTTPGTAAASTSARAAPSSATPPSGTPAAAAADAANALSAVVGTITMARGAPKALPSPTAAATEATKKTSAAYQGASATRIYVAQLRENIYALQDRIAKEPKLTVDDLKAEIAKLTISGPAADAIQQIYSGGDVCAPLKNSTKKQLGQGVARVHDAINGKDGILAPFIADVSKQIDDLKTKINAAANAQDLQSEIDAGYARMSAAFDALDAQKVVIFKTFTTPLDQMRNALPSGDELRKAEEFLFTRLRAEVAQCDASIDDALKAASADVPRISGSLRGLAEQLLADYDAGQRALFDKTRKTLPKVSYLVESQSADLRRGLQKGIQQLLAVASKLDRQAVVSLDDARGWKNDAITATNEAIGAAKKVLDAALVRLDGYGADFDKSVKRQDPKDKLAELWHSYSEFSKEIQFGIRDRINSAMTATDLGSKKSKISIILDDVKNRTSTLTVPVDEVNKKVDDIANIVDQNIDSLCKGGFLGLAADQIGNLISNPAALITALQAKLDETLAGATSFVDGASAWCAGHLRDLEDIERQVANSAAEVAAAAARQTGEVAKQASDAAVRMLSAFGDPPKVPGLAFNRPQIAYFFDESLPHIDTTPMAALFDRLANQELKGVGLRVPTLSLGEHVLPSFDDFKFKLGELFPDIGGIKLDNLFPSLDVGAEAKDKVIVRHGVDKEHRKAWVDAEVRPLLVADSAPIFQFAGLAVSLNRGTFTARAHIEANDKGALDKSSEGKIDGDWKLAFGQTQIVTFKNTPIRFDKSGHLNIDFKAENIQLSPQLSFLNEFLGMYPSSKYRSPVHVGIIQDGLVPSGVECVIDLAVPPMQYGTFGVTGLRFIGGMQIRAYPQFSITVHAALGDVTTPFTLTIFILGGTGWVQTWGRYTPQDNALVSHATLAIGVSAALGFNFGVVNGGVQMVIGVKGDMQTSSIGGGFLSVSVFMLVVGSVDVAGLITASLMLMLEMRIEDGGSVTGEGTAMFSIELSKFYTYRVAQHAEYRLAGSKPKHSDPAAADVAPASASHANSIA